MSVRSLVNIFILVECQFLAQRMLFRAIQDEEMQYLGCSTKKPRCYVLLASGEQAPVHKMAAWWLVCVSMV